MLKIKNLLVVFIVTILFALAGFSYSRFVQPLWLVEMKVQQPRIVSLGNYYPLFSMYQFIKGQPEKENAQVVVYNTLKNVLHTYDMKRKFWLDSEFYKQRITDNKEVDNKLLTKLIKSISVEEKGPITTISMRLENPKQAVALMKEFMTRVNFDTRALVYNQLIIKWQTLFNEVNQAAQLQLGKIKQGNIIDNEDWAGKLKMMKSAKILDKKLMAYSSIQTPTQATIDYQRVISFSVFSAIGGLLFSLLFLNLFNINKRRKSGEEFKKD